MGRIIVALAAIMIAAPPAGAFEIAPQCKTMDDPIGCTCAVQNGGGIAPRRGGGKVWFSKLRRNDPTNEAFVKCQKSARGQR
jgi:hypothetical protein